MQHLNLYDQLDKQVEPPFSFKQTLRIAGFALVLMVVVAALLYWGEASMQAELKQLQQRQQVLSQELDAKRAEKARQQNDPALDRAIAQLRSQVAFRQRLISSINPEDDTLESGFSPHFTSLAKQNIEGMWFTEIELMAGGHELTLMGRTKDPAYLPRYLQKLSSEEVFAGHSFRVFRMNVPTDRRDLLDFELRAKEVGLP